MQEEEEGGRERGREGGRKLDKEGGRKRGREEEDCKLSRRDFFIVVLS
jgi:hypothetical protein